MASGRPSGLPRSSRRGAERGATPSPTPPAAGADCIYPIGVRERDAIRRLVEEVGAPLNVLVMPGGLTLEQLAELGVARASFGSGLMHTAMDAAAQRAADYAAGR